MRSRRPRWKLGAVMALGLVIAGCTVGPDYQRPAVHLPATWTEAQGESVATRSPDLARWWTRFDDPQLSSLVQRALASNLDLRAAEARIREARASRAVTAAGRWPTVDGSASYTRSRDSTTTTTNTGTSVATTGVDTQTNLFATGFDASWEIDVFGGVRRSVEAAEATLAASVEDRRDTLVTLLGDVARNYIELRGFQRRIAVARANLQAQKDTLDLTTVRYKAGLTSYLDVAQAQAQVQTTAATIPPLESSERQALHRLGVLLGRDPGALSAELSTPGPIPALPADVLVGLPSELLRRRPDIRRVERQLASATAEIGVATADLFPKFSLVGSAGLQSISASDWFTSGSRVWSIGPTVSWSILDGGKIRANIEVRKAQTDQKLVTYEQAVLTALEDVENALVSYAREQARHQLLVETVSANRQSLELANERYVKGLENFLTVLDAQRSLLTAEDELTESEATMATNLVALYKALGGGWEGR